MKAGNAGALGTTNGGTFINGGAALDVNGLSLGGEPVTVSGAGVGGSGAILNRGAQITTALRTLTLAGDTTFGGTGRWDIRNSGGAASLLSGGQPYTITKAGTNQVSLVGVNPIDAALGDIDIQQGVFAIQTSTTQVGDPNRTLTVRGGATLNLWALSGAPLNKRIVVEDGGTIWNESGSSVIVGPVTLTNGSATLNVGGTSLTFSNDVISGPGGLVKTGAGTLTLRGLNGYTGGTLISAGMLALAGFGSIGNSAAITVAASAALDVSGRADGQLTLSGGQALGGNGTVSGSLLAAPGSLVSPGTSLGVLTVTNVVTLQGTTFMELDRSAGTNDVIRGAALIQFGGTLALTNLNGALVAGDHFSLFSAANYSGNFGSLDPPTPGPGLRWDTSGLITNGTLRVAAVPVPIIASVLLTPTNLVLGGSNGLPQGGYYLLAATNLALPLSEWSRVATNFFGADGTFRLTNSLDAPACFYLLQSF